MMIKFYSSDIKKMRTSVVLNKLNYFENA